MQTDLVYDVGMNNGDDTAHYLRRGFRVIAVEANPAFVEGAAERFAGEIATGRLVLVNAAIGAARGTTPFFLSDGNRGVWSSFDPAVAGRLGTAVREVALPCVPFADLLAEHGVPYYLKIDIEGADHFCLEGLTPEQLPEYVSFEASEGKLADLYRLALLGYTRFRLVDQMTGWVNTMPAAIHAPAHAAMILRRAARQRLGRVRGITALRSLRRAAAMRSTAATTSSAADFQVSSSGPMPDEVPGPWYSVDEVAYAWMYVAALPERENWYDVHAWH